MNLLADIEQVTILISAAVVIGTLTAGARLFGRLGEQDVEIAYIRQKLDSQFGTNGFVLKNQVGNLDGEIKSISARLNSHIDLHAS